MFCMVDYMGNESVLDKTFLLNFITFPNYTYHK